jgi:hypothetical protein
MSIRSRRAPCPALIVLSILAAAVTTASAATGIPGVTATTPSYTFKLVIGMAAQMWTRAQVATTHPATGEALLMGSMSAISMSGTQRHLEVHIYSRSTGKPVVGAHPTITVTDITAKNAKPTQIPVAEMEGIAKGPADLHYGNNVSLTPGHHYKVTVTLNGQQATLEATAPI